MSRLIRVFSRQTKATPTDALAYFGPPDRFAEADEVHIDCTFTYDKPMAERLAEQRRMVAPRLIGDPSPPYSPKRNLHRTGWRQ